jgi:RNA polymerase sigma-70 factor (ECF subfamily)
VTFFSLFLTDSIARPARSPESFELLYDEYHQPIQRYLYRLCGSADQAEELAQETFLKAYTGLLTFRGTCSVATWLYRIARNSYLNSLRKPVASKIDADALLAIPDTTGFGDPVRQYAAGEQRNLIEMALAGLPEQQRSILLLRDAEELAYVEIADVLGLSVPAVRMKLFRARNAFRVAYCHLSGMEGDDLGEL